MRHACVVSGLLITDFEEHIKSGIIAAMNGFICYCSSYHLIVMNFHTLPHPLHSICVSFRRTGITRISIVTVFGPVMTIH